MKKITAVLASSALAVLLTGCFGPDHVKTVQDGVLANNTTVTVGGITKAYSDCVANTQKWTTSKNAQGARLVQFSCQLVSAKAYFEKARSFQKDVNDIAQSVTNFAKNLTGNDDKVEGSAKPEKKAEETNIFNPKETRLVIEFAMDKTDPKKFAVNGVFVEPNWDGKKVQVEIHSKTALNNLYADQPIFGANFSSLEFTNKLNKAFDARQ